MRRFIGNFSKSNFAFFTEGDTAEIHGLKRLTILADGYITNSDIIVTPNQKTEPYPSGIAQQIGNAYLRWGVDLSKHVLGQYVAAIIVHDDCSVTLVQDSLGIRQMFYSAMGGKFYFSNRLADLAILLKPVELDMEYFADILAKAIVCTERTPYPGIHRLRFGTALVWRADRCVSSRAWSPADVQAPVVKNEREYETILRERLFGAVEPLVGSGERAWSHLSGGLDSTSVLIVALSLEKKIDALTFIDPSGADFGDTMISSSIIEELGIPWHTIDVRYSRPFSGAVPTDFRGEPGAETHSARQTAYHELLRIYGVGVMLTGIGGDVTFGSQDCPPHHLADAFYRLDIVSLYHSIAKSLAQDSQGRSWLHWFINSAASPALRHLFRQKIGKSGASKKLPSWLDHRFVRTHNLRHRSMVQETPRHPEPGRHALWEEIFLQATDLTPSNGVHTSVDFRHPLLDRQLLEFMLSIPFEQRQRPMRDRYLQRRTFRNLLPAIVTNRRNKGSGQRPYDEGLRYGREWLAMLSDEPWLARLGLVDAQRWRQEVDRASFGLYESLPHFAIAACIECWLRCRERGLPVADFELVSWINK